MRVKTWTHDQLAHDLAAHLRGMTDRRVWVDMQLGPAASARPDVYTIPCSFSRFTPLAYEVKVSMADFRRDITKGKYTDYLAYASGVIFACPAGLLKRDDIPAGAGLMTRGDEGWRVVKAPTLTKCPDLPRALWLKLVMDGERRDHERHAYMALHCRRDLVEHLAVEKVRRQFGEVVAAAVQDHRSATTGRLAGLRAAIDHQAMLLEAELARVQQRRSEELADQGRQCSDLLRDLAAAVGMEADPRPAHIEKMVRRLEAMIALSQRDTAVKELLGIVGQFRWGVDRAREIEAAVKARQQQEAA